MSSGAIRFWTSSIVASVSIGALAMLGHARHSQERPEPVKRPLAIVVHENRTEFRVPDDFKDAVAELEVTASSPTHVGAISVGCTCLVVDALLPMEIGAEPVRIKVRVDPARVKPGKFEYAVTFTDGQKIVGRASVKYNFEPHVYADPPALDVPDASWDPSKNLRELLLLLASPEAVEQCRIDMEGDWKIVKVRKDAMGVQLEVSPIRRPSQRVSEGRLRIHVPDLDSPHVVPLRAVFESPVKVEPAAVIFDATASRIRVLRITSDREFDIESVESDVAWLIAGEWKRVDPQAYELRIECSGAREFAEAAIRIKSNVDGEQTVVTVPVVRLQ